MNGIIRVEKNNNYTVLNRAALNDTRLSWKAKGIIAYMLSMPDDWVFHLEELMKHSTDGEKSFRSGFKELKNYGYVKRFPVYKDKKIDHWETVVFEVPQTQENTLLAQNVHVGNVDVRKEGLLSTDSLLSIDNNNVEQVDTVLSVVEYLNVKATKNFDAKSKATCRLINGRLAEGYTLQDFYRVIDIKVNQWLNSPDMNKYLRPTTLFNPTNFENYLNEQAALPVTKKPVGHVSGPLDLNFNQGEEF